MNIKADKKYPIEYIDCSSLCTMMRCPARYFFSRLCGLKSQEATTIHVDYGTDMHAAFPHCYKGLDNLDEAFNAFSRGWSNRLHGNEDTKRNLTRARATLKDFIESHTIDKCDYSVLPIASQIAAPEADRISDNEVPFAIDIGGELPFLGRVDLPVEWKSTGHKWALDYKTAAEVSPRYFRQFYRAPQSVGYTLALTMLTQKEIKGMIIEAIRVSAAKVQTCESQVHHVWVTERQMKEFMELANATALDMLMCNLNQDWPRQSTGCGSYSMFGMPGFFCEYSDLCDAANWQDMAKFYRREKPFHPFVVNRQESMTAT